MTLLAQTESVGLPLAPSAAGDRLGGSPDRRPASPMGKVRVGRERRPKGVTRAVTQFAAAGVIALLALGVASVVSSRRAGTSEAVRDAIDRTGVLAAGVFGPNITPGLIAGEPAARGRLDLATRRLAEIDFAHFRLWTQEGVIVYADEAALIGQVLPLSDDATHAIETDAAHAEVSDLSAPENVRERSQGKLLEVYYPIVASDGTRLLLETYWPMAVVERSAQAIWWQFLPAVLVPLVVLQLIQIPLASRLARRAEADRERLVRDRIVARDSARRMLAHDLHDGTVQELTGVAYSMAALARRLPPPTSDEARALVGAINQSVESLRSLFTEIYPARDDDAPLEASLAELQVSLTGRGIETSVQCSPRLAVEPQQRRIAHRVAQEAARNAARHADADHVWISVQDEGRELVVSVADDGKGFASASGEPPQSPGHLGTRMIRDLVESAGGTVSFRSTPGEGTVVTAIIPR